MTITRKDENGKITLMLDGWLDHENAPKLGEVIDGIDAAETLIFDFEKVEYISSAGIRMLVYSHRKTKALNAAFCVIHVNPEVMSILAMTGLDKKLDIRCV